MAMTPEKKVKNAVVKQLKELKAEGYPVYWFFPATGGYGRSGVPDIVLCCSGRFYAIECKAGKNTPTKLQELEMGAINKAGGHAWVINEKNVSEVKDRLFYRFCVT